MRGHFRYSGARVGCAGVMLVVAAKHHCTMWWWRRPGDRGRRGGSRVLKSDRTGLTAALRYRFTGPVRPVTGGNRLNSNPNSNKFKNSHATGSDRFTGRFDRFTGRFDW